MSDDVEEDEGGARFGAQLRTAREARRMTQQEVADALGVVLRTVGNWERGTTVPRSSIGALEKLLNIEVVQTAAGPMVRFARGPEPALPPVSDTPIWDEIEVLTDSDEARAVVRDLEDDLLRASLDLRRAEDAERQASADVGRLRATVSGATARLAAARAQLALLEELRLRNEYEPTSEELDVLRRGDVDLAADRQKDLPASVRAAQEQDEAAERGDG